MSNYTSNYTSNGLEVSVTLDPMTETLTALVITDHYRRKDTLSPTETNYAWKAAQRLWWENKEGKSPLANLARVYHGMIL